MMNNDTKGAAAAAAWDSSHYDPIRSAQAPPAPPVATWPYAANPNPNPNPNPAATVEQNPNPNPNPYSITGSSTPSSNGGYAWQNAVPSTPPANPPTTAMSRPSQELGPASSTEPPLKRPRTLTLDPSAIPKPSLHKTKLCSRFEAGTCTYDSRCTFAHGVHELRVVPGLPQTQTQNQTQQQQQQQQQQRPLMKTRPCKFFLAGSCPYNERCNFLHNAAAAPSSAAAAAVSGAGGVAPARPANWKTKLCVNWETSRLCNFGERCNFAHGVAELQPYGSAAVNGSLGTNSNTTIPSTIPDQMKSNPMQGSLAYSYAPADSVQSSAYSYPAAQNSAYGSYPSSVPTQSSAYTSYHSAVPSQSSTYSYAASVPPQSSAYTYPAADPSQNPPYSYAPADTFKSTSTQVYQTASESATQQYQNPPENVYSNAANYANYYGSMPNQDLNNSQMYGQTNQQASLAPQNYSSEFNRDNVQEKSDIKNFQ